MFNLYITFQLLPKFWRNGNDFKTLRTSHLAQHHIPGDLNPQQHYGNLESQIYDSGIVYACRQQ